MGCGVFGLDGIPQVSASAVHVVDAAGKQCRTSSRAVWQLIELDPVQVGQGRVPVVRVALELPELARLVGVEYEGASARVGPRARLDFLQVEVVIFQGLFALDDVPSRGNRGDEGASGSLEDKLDGLGVHRLHLGDALEGTSPGANHAGGWKDDTVKGGLHILRSQYGAVVELHPLPQVKGVSQPVIG